MRSRALERARARSAAAGAGGAARRQAAMAVCAWRRARRRPRERAAHLGRHPENGGGGRPAGGDGGGDDHRRAVGGRPSVDESGGGPSGGGGVAGLTAASSAGRRSRQRRKLLHGLSGLAAPPAAGCASSGTAWRAVESGVWRLDSGARVYSSSSSLLTIFATPSSVAWSVARRGALPPLFFSRRGVGSSPCVTMWWTIARENSGDAKKSASEICSSDAMSCARSSSSAAAGVPTSAVSTSTRAAAWCPKTASSTWLYMEPLGMAGNVVGISKWAPR